MLRRQFIATLSSAIATAAAPSARAADAASAPAGEKRPRRPLILGSPITHSDWMVRTPAPIPGPAGVRQILERCAECGWKKVYWRCFDGGRALYQSRLMDPMRGFDEDNYHRGRDSAWVIDKLKGLDWGAYDALQEAVTHGHRLGIEVHAWLSINEDDHAWGLMSRFSRENPQARWVRRDGRPFRSQLSFAFPEVRDHKLALVAEILERKPDGLFIDWIRTGDVRDNPHTDKEGVAIHGYEAPNVQAFKHRYGTDPFTLPNNDDRWTRVRAEPQTTFMRDVRRLVKSKSPAATVSALVHHPWGHRGGPTDTPYKDNLAGLLLDIRTWAAEGLIDDIVAAGYYRPGGTPEGAWRAIRDETGGKIPVWLFGWIGSRDQFAKDVALAEQLGAAQLLLWESDYIGMPPANDAVVKAMASHARL